MNSVSIARGALYIPCELYERWLLGIEAVVLLRRGDVLLVLPVHQAAAGGYLLKRRNAVGDRVAMAADFFRAQGLQDERELCLDAEWDDAMAGIKVSHAFLL